MVTSAGAIGPATTKPAIAVDADEYVGVAGLVANTGLLTTLVPDAGAEIADGTGDPTVLATANGLEVRNGEVPAAGVVADCEPAGGLSMLVRGAIVSEVGTFDIKEGTLPTTGLAAAGKGPTGTRTALTVKANGSKTGFWVSCTTAFWPLSHCPATVAGVAPHANNRPTRISPKYETRFIIYNSSVSAILNFQSTATPPSQT
jgi:hypothetical protein